MSYNTTYCMQYYVCRDMMQPLLSHLPHVATQGQPYLLHCTNYA